MNRKSRKKEEQYLADAHNLQHIGQMESILEQAIQKMDELERAIAQYYAFQPEIRKLEDYYTSPQWKNDFQMDEEGRLPDYLKRGVLSEDGIYNLLERNREILEQLHEL